MGKNNRRGLTSSSKRQKPASTSSHKAQKGSKPSGITKAKPKPKGKSLDQLTKQQLASKAHAERNPTIPFLPSERILLIGEGDLSFARSLVTHHGCENVTATVYEGEKELKEKYPISAEENIAAIEGGGGVVRYGVDAVKMKPWTEGGGGAQERRGTMDRIFFNFPHVGGKTKDVNRQVRYNQELLVSFFKNAIPSLSPRHGSSIIITLFEGEPYTLWNIRDLGRHACLQVEQSFRFQSSAYPGYKHARTLGVVKGNDGEVAGAAWKGEDRRARSFVFVRKGEAPLPCVGVGVGVGGGEAGKGKMSESSDDEDDEFDEGSGSGSHMDQDDEEEMTSEEELGQV